LEVKQKEWSDAHAKVKMRRVKGDRDIGVNAAVEGNIALFEA
jgi:hypothetical protein